MDALTATTIAKSQEPRTPIPPSAASQGVRKNLSYLYDPKNNAHRPASLRTRAGLQTLRYVLTFAFWRIARMVKYALIGSLVAAVGGTVLGPFMGAAAFLVAPSGILAFAGAGLIWGVARFGWKTIAWKIRHGKAKGNARMDERADAGEPPTKVLKTPAPKR
jgi:hypothetical protein